MKTAYPTTLRTHRHGGVHPTGSAAIAAVAAAHATKLLARIAQLEEQLSRQTAVIEDLATQAHIDALTGLYNRRAIEARLQHAVTNFQRYSHQGAVMVIDLNGFKQLNDTHGHAAGDAMLQHVANLLRTSIRLTDAAARLGGDEFVLFLQEATLADAIVKGQQLHHALQAKPLYWNNTPIPASLSLGVAALSEAPSMPAVLNLADQRMYQLKQTLKNRPARLA